VCVLCVCVHAHPVCMRVWSLCSGGCYGDRYIAGHVWLLFAGCVAWTLNEEEGAEDSTLRLCILRAYLMKVQ